MAEAAKKVSTITKLTVGNVEVPVGLYATKADPSKLAQFDTGGPNGGVLKTELRAVEMPVAAQVEEKSDPLAVEDPGPEAPSPVEAPREANGARVAQGEYGQVLVEEGSGGVVEAEQVRRGVRLEDGRFVDCTEQLDAIAEQTKLDEMRLVGFVDAAVVDRTRVLGSYYLAPREVEGLAPLQLLWHGMRERRRVAVAKLTKTSRQSLVVVAPYGSASEARLMVLQLVWAEDFRPMPKQANLSAQDVGLTADHYASAVELVEAMSYPPGLVDELRDDAIALREELRGKAERGEVAVVVEPPEEESGVADIAGLLEASIAQAKGM